MHTVGQFVIPLFLSRSLPGRLLSILTCIEVFLVGFFFVCFVWLVADFLFCFFLDVLLECFLGFFLLP